MGKRLKRILNHQLSQESENLLGKEVDVILFNRATFHGMLTEMTTDQLILKDKLSNKIKFPLSEIQEIIYDYQAPY